MNNLNRSEQFYNKIFKIIPGEKSYINFHNHTIYSDGEHNIRELLEEAKELGITNIAITDHDTIDAYVKGNALNIAEELGINLVTGTEVTIKTTDDIKFQVHMLLFFPEELLQNSDFINEFNDKIGQNRGIDLLEKRIKAINYHFGNEGIHLTIDNFSHLNLNNITTGHTAKALEKKYPHLKDGSEESKRIIGKQSPAYIKAGTDIETVVNFKNKYNLVSVMAHPIREKEMEHSEEIMKYIQNLIDINFLDGLEMTHPELTNESKSKLKELDVNIYTAGSDTHNIEGKRKVKNYNVNNLNYKK